MAEFTTKKFLDNTGLAIVWGQIKTLMSNYINNFKDTLDSTSTANGTYVDVTVKLVDGSLATTGAGVSIDETELISTINTLNNGVTDASNYITSAKPKTDAITIDGNTFKVSSSDGVNASNFTTASGNLNSVISDLGEVLKKLDVADDNNEVIDRLHEILDYFKEFPEEQQGMIKLVAHVDQHHNAINTLADLITKIDNKIVGLTTESEEHAHSYTPAGSVSLIDSYSNGILTLTASFSGTDATISGGSHNHGIAKPENSNIVVPDNLLDNCSNE